MIKPTRRAYIEPLESRIAPALLVNGANLLGGHNGPTTGETSVGGNALTLVKVSSGEAIVWYFDGAIESISFGPNTSLTVYGSVQGDIVGNLLANGRLSDTDNNPLNGEDGGVLLPNNLLGLTAIPLTGANQVIGNIITGGSVSNVTVEGQIGGIYAGDGVFNAASKLIDDHGVVTSSLGPLEFNPFDPSQTAFHFSQLPGLEASASISNLNLTKVQNFQAIAGSGNPNHLGLTNLAGQAGGSISNVTIDSAVISIPPGSKTAPPSYELIAGDGASGAKGGAGGSINNVVEHSSSGQVIIQAGMGGNGGKAAGGNGGSVTNLDLESSSSQYSVLGGNGGSGAPGGAGGSTVGNSFANNTPAGGVIVAADFTGDGADDVLIADQGTGNMVLEANNGQGANFTSVVQTGTSGPPTLIAAPGGSETPIAAAAITGSEGPLPDILVAYQGSNTLVYFHNQGTLVQGSDPAQYENAGDFWNPSLNNGAGGFDTLTVGLSFSPSEMAVLDGNGTEVALASNANGKSTIHLVAPTLGNAPAEIAGSASLPSLCVGLVSAGDGTIFAALANGSIYALTVQGLANQPFTPPVLQSSAHVVGGISQFTADSSGSHLLALAANGKTLYTFNESSGSLTSGPSVNLANLGATPDVAHFYQTGSNESIALLSSRSTGSQINLYSLTEDTSAGNPITSLTPQTPPLTTDNTLHNFTVANSGTSGPGFAGLQGALGQFTFDLNFTPIFTNFALPFASKTVLVQAGDGGNGIDLSSTKFGNGGAGGNVSGLNADAETLDLLAGNGGGADHGAGGDGGSITNPKKITTHGTGTVATAINAAGGLTIIAGIGGSPTEAGGKQASGGDGGSIGGFTANLKAGQNDTELNFIAGDGGDGLGGAGGAGGSISNIQTTGADGNLSITAGHGGDAEMGATSTSGNGGNAGSITNFGYTLTLSNQTAAIEKPHNATVTTQDGGTSVTGTGGAGGSVSNVSLQMQSANITFDVAGDPPQNNDSQLDSTVTVNVTTGNGGQGAKGGNGGSVTNFQYGTTITQVTSSGSVIAPFVVLGIVTGNGGTGTATNGGAGGNISFSKPISGVTYMDQDEASPDNNLDRIPLFVIAGDGGNGATFGGNGGSISGLTAQNSPLTGATTNSTGSGSSSTTGSGGSSSNTTTVIETTLLAGAVVAAGNGGNGGTGNGGAGGSISKALIGVEIGLYEQADTGSRSTASNVDPIFYPIQGFLEVTGGTGGNGGTSASAKGGAGGSVNGVSFGLVSTAEDVGMTILGGDGGTGVAAGGAGGGLSSVSLSITQNTVLDTAPSALLMGGKGGDVNSASGVGGAGGSITKVGDNKDENSAISLIQAGNGGDNPLGKAGNGGNVSNIDTVGFIGRPSDSSGPLGVFDLIGAQPFAQGLFSGRGGVGATNGVNGSIINVIARQIAAMSAAEDPLAETFAAASKISNVTADLIGYDFYRGTGNPHEGVYTDSTGGSSSPSSVVPLDGFILGTVITNVSGEQTGFVFTS